MKRRSIPLNYWLLGITLAFPFIAWILVTRILPPIPFDDAPLHHHWHKYLIARTNYGNFIVGYCIAGIALASMVFYYHNWVEDNWQKVLNFFLAASLLGFITYSLRSSFSIDEFEHIHVSWNISNGLQPYTDFFEHHHGLMWYILAPLIPLVENHSTVLLLSRIISLGFWLLTLLGVYRTALLLTGNRTASKISVLLLLTCFVCTKNAIEFRPDNPQVTFGIWSLYFFFRFRKFGGSFDMLISGIFMGISFLFLQKALHFCAVLGCYQLFLALTRRISWTSVGIFTVACLVPVLPFALLYLVNGLAGEYYFFNWTLNFNKIASVGTWIYLIPDLLLDPFLLLLFGIALISLLRKDGKVSLDMKATAIMTIALVLIAFSHPNAWPHYFMPAWPVAAIFTGFFLNQRFGHIQQQYQAAILLYITGFSFGITTVSSFVYSNQIALDQTNYLQKNGISDNYAADRYLHHNAFAKDMHFFWFSFKDHLSYPVYKELINKEPYSSWVKEHHDDFDFGHLLETKRPKFIHINIREKETPFAHAPEIIQRYEPGPWEGLYQIKAEYEVPAQ
jgi:hypothetical protein